MCNAWNHPPGCTCGWGGEGHAGGRGPSPYLSPFVQARSILSFGFSYESFTQPNATCPVCGASVFFYQSPYGGRVFFDELGPPWPKHPCTDSSFLPIRAAHEVTTRLKTYSWQEAGWKPFKISMWWSVTSKGISVIAGTLDGELLRLEVTMDSTVKVLSSWPARERVAQLRKIRIGEYDLSVLDPNGSPVYCLTRTSIMGLLVTQAFYDKLTSKLVELEKNLFKLTIRVKKESETAGWQLPSAVTHLDSILQAAINAACYDYLKNDDLSLFDKLFAQEALYLHGKKRGLGAEIERYLKCVLPSLRLKSKGEGTLRKLVFVRKPGVPRALFVYGLESKIIGSNKQPLTPFIGLANWLKLECELKKLRQAHNKAAELAHESALKEWEESLPSERRYQQMLDNETALLNALESQRELSLNRWALKKKSPMKLPL